MWKGLYLFQGNSVFFSTVSPFPKRILEVVLDLRPGPVVYRQVAAVLDSPVTNPGSYHKATEKHRAPCDKMSLW